MGGINVDERKIVELADDAKTIVEYEAILLRFLRTGMLDRADAIAKCKKFYITHPEYVAWMNAQNIVYDNLKPWEELTDGEVGGNMNRQLIYIGGKNMLEGIDELTRKA